MRSPYFRATHEKHTTLTIRLLDTYTYISSQGYEVRVYAFAKLAYTLREKIILTLL